ncbi:MAG: DNA topology modulation protein [Elainellaceae cyanobacterium]
MMQKVLVLGSGGAGKSTFARELAERLQLEVIHLDAHYWKSGWVEPSQEEWRACVEALIQREQWVMDGNYSATLDLRLPAADTVIFLDLPRLLCLWRIVRRRFQYAGTTRPDMAIDCPEQLNWQFIRYVWNYPQQRRPQLLRRLQHLSEHQTAIVLTSPAQVRQFLQKISAPKTGHSGVELSS